MVHCNSSKHCTTCTYLLGLEGVIVGDVGLAQYLQGPNAWCCYGMSVCVAAARCVSRRAMCRLGSRSAGGVCDLPLQVGHKCCPLDQLTI